MVEQVEEAEVVDSERQSTTVSVRGSRAVTECRSSSRYGACNSPAGVATDNDSVPTWQWWGQPWYLFIDAMGYLCPVVLSMYVIAEYAHDFRESIFIIDTCSAFPDYHLRCEYTRLFVRYAPHIMIVICLSAVAWRMVSSRLFYALLEHKLLLAVPERSSFVIDACVLTIFGTHIVYHWHLLIKLQSPAVHAKELGLPESQIGETYVDGNLSDLLLQPQLIFSPRNLAFVLWLNAVARQFMIPMVVALLSFYSLQDFKKTLLPLAVYCEPDASGRHTDMTRILYITRQGLESLMVGQVPAYPGCHLQPLVWSEFCDLVYERARIAYGTSKLKYIGALPGVSIGEQPRSAPSIMGSWRWLYRCLSMESFAVRVLLFNNLTDCDSVHFRHVWRCYVLIRIAILCSLVWMASDYMQQVVAQTNIMQALGPSFLLGEDLLLFQSAVAGTVVVCYLAAILGSVWQLCAMSFSMWLPDL